MDRAYASKLRDYETQVDACRALQRLRDQNRPRIETLNSQQQAAYESMKSAFDSASAAYNSGDRESARRLADEGHSYKAEAQAAVVQRRRLVNELREARDYYDATKPAFQQAKADFDRAKGEYDGAKSQHESASEVFRQAKDDFDRAKTSFADRLTIVRAENEQSKNDRRAIAQRAGVPTEYLDDLRMSTGPDGTVNIYFGGIGEPNGPGHGHYTMNSSANLTYRRDPFDPHGAENFTDHVDHGTTRIRFSGVHTGDQPFPHVDANKRVDGKQVRDKSMHHQPQSPGYGQDSVDVPVRQTQE